MRRGIALLGLFTVLLGILVEILIRYWISIGRPTISTGPITLASIGFTCLSFSYIAPETSEIPENAKERVIRTKTEVVRLPRFSLGNISANIPQRITTGLGMTV
jgi:hypothetical protein